MSSETPGLVISEARTTDPARPIGWNLARLYPVESRVLHLLTWVAVLGPFVAIGTLVMRYGAWILGTGFGAPVEPRTEFALGVCVAVMAFGAVFVRARIRERLLVLQGKTILLMLREHTGSDDPSVPRVQRGLDRLRRGVVLSPPEDPSRSAESPISWEGGPPLREVTPEEHAAIQDRLDAQVDLAITAKQELPTRLRNLGKMWLNWSVFLAIAVLTEAIAGARSGEAVTAAGRALVWSITGALFLWHAWRTIEGVPLLYRIVVLSLAEPLIRIAAAKHRGGEGGTQSLGVLQLLLGAWALERTPGIIATFAKLAEASGDRPPPRPPRPPPPGRPPHQK